MRVIAHPLLRFGYVHQAEHLNGTALGLFGTEAFVQTQGFSNLLTHRQDRVERGHGFLKDHGNLTGTNLLHRRRVGLHQVLPFKPNLAIGNAPRWHGQQLHDGHGRDTFAATGLPHHAQRFAAVDVKTHPIDRMQDTIIGVKVHLQILNFQQRLAHPSTSLKHAARIIGIAQTVTNVVDGQHGDKYQHARKQGPVRRNVHVVLGVKQNAAPGGDVGRKTQTQK